MCFIDHNYAGILLQPTNLSVTLKTHSLIYLEWTPPFSLNVAHHDPDISHYVILITNPTNGMVKTEVTTNPSYAYHRQESICHNTQLVFQVAAVNEVGTGNLSDTVEAEFAGCESHN